MAEQDNQETEAGQKSGGKGGLIVMLVVALAAVGGGISLPFVIDQITAASAADPEEDTLPEPEPDEETDFVPFDEVTVNLDQARFSRFLRLKFHLQVAKSQKMEIEKQVEAKQVVFKNWLQIHLSEKGVDELQGSFNRNRVRREIQDFFNKTLFDDGIERIQDVLFEEFHVQ